MKVLLLLIMMLSALVYTYPHKRSSGFDRLRDRIHRKRHRHHHHHHHHHEKVNETDELFEMSLTSPAEDVEDSDGTSSSSSSSKIRSEKSIGSVTSSTTPSEKKTSGRREKNEALCQSRRTTIELNSHSHEFEPPFFVEVRCLNTPTSSSSIGNAMMLGGGGQEEQTCFKGMLRCVQQYQDVHVSRRGVGSVHWHPYTLSDVAVSCECMWPVDKFGHQEF